MRPEVPAAAHAQQSSVARESPEIAPEAVAREPLRCCFGAVRVGALLGRVRLHLQTDRFLAVHRGDALWDQGCLAAAFALADIVAGMPEAELDALLTPQHAQKRRLLGTPPPSAKSGPLGMTIPGAYGMASGAAASRDAR